MRSRAVRRTAGKGSHRRSQLQLLEPPREALHYQLYGFGRIVTPASTIGSALAIDAGFTVA